MKRLVYIYIILLFPATVFGQQKTVKNNPEYDDEPKHFGFSVGLNTMDFKFGRIYNPNIGDTSNYYSDVATLIPGFQVNMIAEFRLAEYFSLFLNPGFAFGQRNIGFYRHKKLVHEMKLESSFLEFPVLIKYKSKRINNFRPYLIGGGNVRYDLAPKKKIKTGEAETIILNRFDVYYEFGFGIDYYFPFFKLSTEIKYSVGLTNVIDPPTSGTKSAYVKAINELNSNVLMLTFHFQ